MMSLLPGFQTPVQNAQQTFRQLLAALSRPGQIGELAMAMTPPAGLSPSCAAVCLTLLDLETTVWLAPELASAASWLAFHTGCRQATSPQTAAFAVLPAAQLPNLDTFFAGSPTDPESGATLLMQTSQLSGGSPVNLSGPGILGELTVSPKVPREFWTWWTANHQQYPMGVDVFLFSEQAVMGLPRSTRAEVSR
ncbi:MAG: phosphonate C-P lyase system protein PhnH [Cyanobacteria bacterium J06626_23]